eukprot:CAMPEP_0170566064 /NCGR_PEP_ID=MMETSP0211-20121228/79598_1 /TAXON_ID=311385 /ORGANISM="Pseudokeronopsis sp., Strain OXSARD2" /LENGTH=85 /DNA_ID=CAMNT_0010887135 /DNA_START=680 /DNA_END=937 /DNA_ORIENTATION=-
MSNFNKFDPLISSTSKDIVGKVGVLIIGAGINGTPSQQKYARVRVSGRSSNNLNGIISDISNMYRFLSNNLLVRLFKVVISCSAL